MMYIGFFFRLRIMDFGGYIFRWLMFEREKVVDGVCNFGVSKFGYFFVEINFKKDKSLVCELCKIEYEIKSMSL